VDVPAKLAARVRVLSVGHGRKSDPDDAVSVAVAAAMLPGCARLLSKTGPPCCTC
jgi:transposase